MPEPLTEELVKKVQEAEKKPVAEGDPENPKKNRVVRSSPEIKLKDKVGRNMITINFKEVFGFQVEEITITKVPNSHDKIQVHAVLPPEEVERYEKAKAAAIEQENKIKKIQEAVEQKKKIDAEQKELKAV